MLLPGKAKNKKHSFPVLKPFENIAKKFHFDCSFLILIICDLNQTGQALSTIFISSSGNSYNILYESFQI